MKSTFPLTHTPSSLSAMVKPGLGRASISSGSSSRSRSNSGSDSPSWSLSKSYSFSSSLSRSATSRSPSPAAHSKRKSPAEGAKRGLSPPPQSKRVSPPPRKASPIPESLVLHVDQLSRSVNENHLKEIFDMDAQAKAFSERMKRKRGLSPAAGSPSGAAVAPSKVVKVAPSKANLPPPSETHEILRQILTGTPVIKAPAPIPIAESLPTQIITTELFTEAAEQMYNHTLQLTRLSSIFRFSKLQPSDGTSARLREMEEQLIAEKKARVEAEEALSVAKRERERAENETVELHSRMIDLNKSLQDAEERANRATELEKRLLEAEEKIGRLQVGLDKASAIVNKVGRGGELAVEAYKQTEEFQNLVEEKYEGFYTFGFDRACELMKRRDLNFSKEDLDGYMSPPGSG